MLTKKNTLHLRAANQIVKWYTTFHITKLSQCITNLRVQQNLKYNRWLRPTTTIASKHCHKNVGIASPRWNDSHNNTSTELMLWEPARTTILFKFNNGSLLESTNFIKTIKISSSCKLLQKHSIVTAYFTFNARFKLQIKGSTHYWLKGRYQNIISYRHWLEWPHERRQGDFAVWHRYMLKNLRQIPIASRKVLLLFAGK